MLSTFVDHPPSVDAAQVKRRSACLDRVNFSCVDRRNLLFAGCRRCVRAGKRRHALRESYGELHLQVRAVKSLKVVEVSTRPNEPKRSPVLR